MKKNLPNAIEMETEDGYKFILFGERPIEEAATDMLADAVRILSEARVSSNTPSDERRK